MAEVRIYKLNLDAGDVNIPGTFHSSLFGGSGTPDPNYPEFAQMEQIHRVENAGASGQHVLDATETDEYTLTWITLGALGPLANGQFDCRGGGPGKPLKVRWRQHLNSAAYAEAEFSQHLQLCHGDVDGLGSGLFAGQRFLGLLAFRSDGLDRWMLEWRTVHGSLLPFGGASGASGWVWGPTYAPDDAEHEIIVTLKPSTVTGEFSEGMLGSATVASDGCITVRMDGTVLVSAQDIQFVVNNFGSGDGKYYGKTLWHGD